MIQVNNFILRNLLYKTGHPIGHFIYISVRTVVEFHIVSGEIQKTQMNLLKRFFDTLYCKSTLVRTIKNGEFAVCKISF